MFVVLFGKYIFNFKIIYNYIGSFVYVLSNGLRIELGAGRQLCGRLVPKILLFVLTALMLVITLQILSFHARPDKIARQFHILKFHLCYKSLNKDPNCMFLFVEALL